MSGDRLTGQEPDVDFLMQMGFNAVELEKIRQIKHARPRSMQGRRNDIPVLPKKFSEYNYMQKCCYADVFGDVAAEVIWGRGPWMKTFRKARAEERRRKFFEKAS